MRKFVASILILLYFAVSTGAPIHAHYCMGKIISWSFTHTSDADKCPNCGMHQKKGCCEDKQTILKVSEKYKPASNPSYNANLSTFVSTISLENKKIVEPTSIKGFPFIPSRWKAVSIYKLHCVFLI